ncbi:MAG: hypothetical protein J6V01_06945, partial [Clostridia bacterium]|nr:hypothetical protein [Clostridia bacterium]
MSLFKRLTIIAFALLLALSAAACGPASVTPSEDGTTGADASTVPPEQTEAVESDTDDYIIAENGSARCSIVTRPGAVADEKVLAVSIKTALKTGYGVDIEVREGSGGAGEREIIIGAFFDGIDPDAYSTARYGVWGAARRGNKLLLYALDSKSYSNAASVLPKYIGRGSDEKTVKLRSVFYSTEVVHALPVAIPAAGNAVASYVQHTGGTDTSKKCTQVAFKSVQEDFFKSYCATLESLSYEKKLEHSIGGNSYTAYVREGDMLSVDYFPTLRLMRVISEPAYETPVWDLASGERTGDVKLFQIKDTTNEHASCFIVTLADGRYLIYDTGVAATA